MAQHNGNKEFKTRIISKHDIEVNWNKAENFIPLQGELIIYDIDENYSYERFKIGDGVQNVIDLPFANDALKADLLDKITAVDDKVNDLVGNTPVSEQIANATSDVIRYSEQYLTDEQKEQTRENIGVEIATDDEIIEMLTQIDMFPVVTDSDGSVLADESDNILLW